MNNIGWDVKKVMEPGMLFFFRHFNVMFVQAKEKKKYSQSNENVVNCICRHVYDAVK